MSITNNEYWDLFDNKKEIRMKHHRRGDRIPDGLYHLVVHSWIMDPSGLFLMSQRQEGRPYAFKWERTGGSVLEGENSLDGALREVREELGLDLSENERYFIKSKKRARYHDFFDAWLFIVDKDNVQCQIDNEEVRDFKWFNLRELDELKEKDGMVPSSTYYHEVYALLKEIKNKNNKTKCECGTDMKNIDKLEE